MTFDIRAVQQRLAALGFDPGPVDGIRGPKTDAAIIAFKRSIGYRATDYLGPLTHAALMQAGATATELPWMAKAREAFGWHETRDNAKLRAWLRSDNATLGDPRALPWCGDFVETAIKTTLPDEEYPGALGSNPYWAQNWKLLGRPVAPTYGAVLVFLRDGGGHVGFAVGEDATDYYVLGGNQSNAVTITRIDKNRMIASRWPETWAHSHVPLPRMTATGIPRSTNEF